MIEVLNSKRMTLVILILIVVCTIVVIVEEWFANSRLVISSDINVNNLTLSRQEQPTSSNVISDKRQQQQQQQLPNPSQASQKLPTYRDDINTETAKCWLTESYEIITPCALCNIYELETSHLRYHANIHICSTTGFKELIYCAKSGPVERACRTDWRHFLTFLGFMGFFGGVFGLLERYRLFQVRNKTLARFRKQQDDIDDDSHHTLIDMNSSY